MRIVWCSDVHLDHARGGTIDSFLDDVRSASPDLLLVTGDISVAPRLAEHLAFLASASRVRFVLGNHDYWGGSIARLREKLAGADVGWLGVLDPIELALGACLVGVDGWYDGRANEGEEVKTGGLLMNDWWNIAEYVEGRQVGHRRISRDLADDDTRTLEERLRRAIGAGYRRVIVATHVPPFQEASRYRGRPGPRENIGFFSNVGMGRMLLRVAGEHPEVQLEVLCGHTHDEYEHRAAHNLLVRVAGASYRYPEIARVFEVG